MKEKTEIALLEMRINKSNALVQASYKLSLNEQRLVLACIAKIDSKQLAIRPGFDQINGIQITASDFAETFNIDMSNAYRELKNAADSIYERDIKTYDGKVRERFRWVYKAIYHEDKGYVELSFTPDCAVYLTLLREQFTSYQVKQIANLRSTYSIRLFEMLMQFKGTGLLRIELEKFIELLSLPYKRYADIKRRVIDPAVEELTEKSNLIIEWTPIKKGRAVHALEFNFEEAEQLKLPLQR